MTQSELIKKWIKLAESLESSSGNPLNSPSSAAVLQASADAYRRAAADLEALTYG